MKRYIKRHKILFITTLMLRVSATIIWVYFAKVMEYMVNSTSKISLFFENAILVLIYIIVVRVIGFLGEYSNSIFSNKIIYELRNDYVKSVFNKKRIEDSGEVISKLDNDLQIIKDYYLENFITLITSVISFILSSILLLQISIIITIILYILILIIFVIPYISRKRLKKIHLNYSNSLKCYTSNIKDFTQGFDVIRNNLLENKVCDKLENLNKDIKNSRIKLEVSNSLIAEISHTFTTILGAAGFVLGIYFVLKGEFQYGTMIAIVQLTNTLASPINVLTKNIGKLIGSKQIVKEFVGNLNGLNSVQESKVKVDNFEELTFDEVSLIIDDKIILENINLYFEKGKKYLIIGESGSGKTSLIKLIMGRHLATEGKITINGYDIQSVSREDLCSIFATIEQEVHLFNTSIKNNITLYDNFDYIETVINDVRLDYFIEGLEDNLNTLVVENGDNFSGGEKQRISIARFICSRKQVCLSDEITSSLDANIAKDIEDILLNSNITLINISHKYDHDSLKKYDEIIILEKGKIIKKGNYQEVINYIR